jgi:hypothetical protein
MCALPGAPKKQAVLAHRLCVLVPEPENFYSKDELLAGNGLSAGVPARSPPEVAHPPRTKVKATSTERMSVFI